MRHYQPTFIAIIDSPDHIKKIQKTVLKSNRILFFPTSIRALNYLTFHQIKFHRLDDYIKPKYFHNISFRTPFELTKKIIKYQPSLKIFIDLIRHDLTLNLSSYFILKKLYSRIPFQSLYLSSSSLSIMAARFFCWQHHLSLKISDSRLNIRDRFQSLFHQLIFFAHHLRDLITVCRQLFLPPASDFTTNKELTRALCYSSGLSLASYHSLIKVLVESNRFHLTLISHRQNLIDKLYLAKYSLNPKEINLSITPSQRLPFSFPVKFGLLNTLIKNSLRQVLKHDGPRITAQLIQARSIINRYRPRLVIVTHDPGPSGLSFVLAAQEKGIPTLVLLHGSPSHVHFFFADKQLVWGPLLKRLLVTKAKVNPDRLITGFHPIDLNYKQFFIDQKKLNHPFTVTILTSGDGRHEWHQHYYLYDLFKCLSQLSPRPKIILRCHPMQVFSDINRLAKKLNLEVIFPPPLHLEECIAAADIIISQNSSALLPALLANKPTILYDSWFPLYDSGLLQYSRLLLKSTNLNNLPHLINKIKIDRRYKKQILIRQNKFVSQYCGPVTKQNPKRLLNKIIKYYRL